MGEVSVQPVTTRSEQRQFINFPWTLYRGDPNWVPPLLHEHRKLLNYRHHPFYDDAEIQTFLARSNGEVVGRVAALVNHAHNRHMNEKLGFFGFFESIDDQAVANALFDAARRWLLERQMVAVRGPCNPSLNYELGLLIDGFESPPTFMIPYNKPYYARLIEGWGFATSQNLFTFSGHTNMLGRLDKKLLFIADEAQKRFNITVRPMNKRRIHQEMQLFQDVYNQSLGRTWGFVPMSAAEVKAVGDGAKYLIVPELCVIAEIDGQPIGLILALPDYNPRIKQIDGRLFPFGFLRLLYNKRGISKLRVVSVNVVPEFQRWGLGVVLLRALVAPMLKVGIKEVEFSFVLESNQLSRGSLERGGAQLDKKYRVYDREL